MSNGSDPKHNSENDCGAVEGVQQAMLKGAILDESSLEHVEEMQKRLDRVRGWAGAYSQIEFSPDMKLLIKQMKKKQSKMTLS